MKQSVAFKHLTINKARRLPTEVDQERWSTLVRSRSRPASISKTRWSNWRLGINAPRVETLREMPQILDMPDSDMLKALGWDTIEATPLQQEGDADRCVCSVIEAITVILAARVVLSVHSKAVLDQQRKERGEPTCYAPEDLVRKNDLHRRRLDFIRQCRAMGRPLPLDVKGRVITKDLVLPPVYNMFVRPEDPDPNEKPIAPAVVNDRDAAGYEQLLKQREAGRDKNENEP